MSAPSATKKAKATTAAAGSKRKEAAPAAAPTPMKIVQVADGDDSGDDAEEVEDAPKGKKARTEDDAAAPALTKAEQLKALLAGMSDAEKMEINLAPLAAAAASSSSSALVPAAAAAGAMAVIPAGDAQQQPKYTSLNPYVDTLLENEGEVPPATAFVTAFESCNKLVRGGACRVKNPDLALALAAVYNGGCVGWMEVDAFVKKTPHLLFVNRTYEKMVVGGKRQDDKEKPHVNPRLKREQHFMPAHVRNVYGLTVLSPFCSLQYYKYGPTVELGVEGTNGKEINDAATPPLQSQYQATLTNKPVTSLVVDENFNNPIADLYLNFEGRLNETLMAKAMENPDNMTELRKIANKQLKDKSISAVPSTGEEWVKWMKANNKLKTLEREDEADETWRGVQCSVSVFRQPVKTRDSTGKVTWCELDEDKDLTPQQVEAKRHPSALFKEHRVNKNGQDQIHNEIPTFRCRRADELIEGKPLPTGGPFIRVAFSRTSITPQHKIAMLYSKNIYEWKFDKAGITNKPLAQIVLGTHDQLKNLTLDDVVAVDPRYAIPMAQPFGEEDLAPIHIPGVTDEKGNWSGFAAAAPADPDHAAAGFGSS